MRKEGQKKKIIYNKNQIKNNNYPREKNDKKSFGCNKKGSNGNFKSSDETEGGFSMAPPVIQGYLIIVILMKAIKKMKNIVFIEILVIIMIVVLYVLLKMKKIIMEKPYKKKFMKKNLCFIRIIKSYERIINRNHNNRIKIIFLIILNNELLILFIKINDIFIFPLLIKYYYFINNNFNFFSIYNYISIYYFIFL